MCHYIIVTKGVIMTEEDQEEYGPKIAKRMKRKRLLRGAGAVALPMAVLGVIFLDSRIPDPSRIDEGPVSENSIEAAESNPREIMKQNAKAEILYMTAQELERKAGLVADPEDPEASALKERAMGIYTQILKDYPNATIYVDKALDELRKYATTESDLDRQW